MVIFDSKQVRDYAASVNAELDRCEREGMLCSDLDSSLSCCADLCCKFAGELRRWAQDVFHGRVAFDATTEQFWKAELMRIYERAHTFWSQGRLHEESCFVLDGLKKLESLLWTLKQLINGWVSPKLAVAPSARQQLPAHLVDQARQRVPSLPPLPVDPLTASRQRQSS
jgi:hypothetical protein